LAVRDRHFIGEGVVAVVVAASVVGDKAAEEED
jgi:hypothetical protein